MVADVVEACEGFMVICMGKEETRHPRSLLESLEMNMRGATLPVLNRRNLEELATVQTPSVFDSVDCADDAQARLGFCFRNVKLFHLAFVSRSPGS
jgi:hypothetical protein